MTVTKRLLGMIWFICVLKFSAIINDLNILQQFSDSLSNRLQIFNNAFVSEYLYGPFLLFLLSQILRP